MTKTRNGKIARLPRALREQLNQRLADGEPGNQLVTWLNGLPEVRQCLAERFDGRPLSEQNLSEWKAGGYEDWLDQQAALEMAGRIAENADELTQVSEEPFTDKLALWLVARYMVATRKLEAAGEGEASAWNRMRELCKDIVALRRGDHCAERLKLDTAKANHAQTSEQERALDICLTESKQYPEVADMFRAAFKLLDQRRKGYSPDDQTESDPIKPSEIRRPKPEIRKKSEGRNPNQEAESDSTRPGEGGETAACAVSPGAADQTESDLIKPIGADEGSWETPVRADQADQTESDSIKPPKIRSPRAESRKKSEDRNPNRAAESNSIQPGDDEQMPLKHTGPNLGLAETPAPQPPVPLLDPKQEAYNTWFRMSQGAEPFDPEKLEKLYAAIPPGKT